MPMTFNDDHLQTISNALRVAADKFREDFNDIEKLIKDSSTPEPGLSRLADQFARQALEAARLYDTIAEKTGICS